jgi:vitamin B12/bleomycin/antimicrobial peptide transport system ATP-binding/permease protein
MIAPLGSDARPKFWPTFWRLCKPYWFSEDRWLARLLFAAIVVLNLAIVWVNVQLNTWNGAFYNALQDKKFDDFKRLLFEFTGWAFLYILLVVYQLYLTQMLQIRWRRWLTEVYLKRWLDGAVHYRMTLARQGTDNPDQRIAEDFREFVNDTLSLFFGLLSSSVTFVSFVGILWALSGAVSIAGVQIPGYMVWVAIAYALFGSLIAHWVGKPLIKLNFEQERYEADFRYSLVRVRENSEGIALYRGESVELDSLNGRFAQVARNWWAIMKIQKRFVWFSTFYGQLAIIFPMVVAAPRYFSGAIALGGLMQTASAFGQVQSSLSWFVDAYTKVASWRASIERLDGFVNAIESTRQMDHDRQLHIGDRVELGQVQVDIPVPEKLGESALRPLLQASAQTLEAGLHTLISGPSGSGKSTLLRVLAGIWPFVHGRLQVSDPQHSLFLPQKPYFPLGSLRQVLAYPRGTESLGEHELLEALEQVGMSSLASRLDEQALWSQLLSGGEQQRIAIARALLFKPNWLFLDEATSALDEAAESQLYQTLKERLPDCTLVSVAHRANVARFHQQVLRLLPVAGQATGLRLEN